MNKKSIYRVDIKFKIYTNKMSCNISLDGKYNMSCYDYLDTIEKFIVGIFNDRYFDVEEKDPRLTKIILKLGDNFDISDSDIVLHNENNGEYIKLGKSILKENDWSINQEKIKKILDKLK
jgi:hypothetical protein